MDLQVTNAPALKVQEKMVPEAMASNPQVDLADPVDEVSISKNVDSSDENASKKNNIGRAIASVLCPDIVRLCDERYKEFGIFTVAGSALGLAGNALLKHLDKFKKPSEIINTFVEVKVPQMGIKTKAAIAAMTLSTIAYGVASRIDAYKGNSKVDKSVNE